MIILNRTNLKATWQDGTEIYSIKTKPMLISQCFIVLSPDFDSQMTVDVFDADARLPETTWEYWNDLFDILQEELKEDINLYTGHIHVLPRYRPFRQTEKGSVFIISHPSWFDTIKREALIRGF